MRNKPQSVVEEPLSVLSKEHNSDSSSSHQKRHLSIFQAKKKRLSMQVRGKKPSSRINSGHSDLQPIEEHRREHKHRKDSGLGHYDKQNGKNSISEQSSSSSKKSSDSTDSARRSIAFGFEESSEEEEDAGEAVIAEPTFI